LVLFYQEKSTMIKLRYFAEVSEFSNILAYIKKIDFNFSGHPKA